MVARHRGERLEAALPPVTVDHEAGVPVPPGGGAPGRRPHGTPRFRGLGPPLGKTSVS